MQTERKCLISTGDPLDNYIVKKVLTDTGMYTKIEIVPYVEELSELLRYYTEDMASETDIVIGVRMPIIGSGFNFFGSMPDVIKQHCRIILTGTMLDQEELAYLHKYDSLMFIQKPFTQDILKQKLQSD